MAQQKRRRLPEASYIPKARDLVKLAQVRKQALTSIKQTKREIAVAMHRDGVSHFPFDVDGQSYKATLKRPTVQSVCLQKLYTAVRAEEITLDEFLRCVTPDNEQILALYGQDFLDRVSTYERGPIDLVISERK